MINLEEEQKIKNDVQLCFIERNESAIQEKISYCIVRGMPEDKARHTVIQVVKNLPNYLLPIKVTPQGDAVSDYKLKLTLADAELAKHAVGLATHFPNDDFE